MATDMKIVLPGSYQQYKTDTAAFLTWLLRTAKTCGYEFTTSSAQDETAQEASVLLKVAGRNMPVREVLVQARLIRASSSPLCKIPAGVVKLAERAISGRQTRTEHFKTMHPSAADDTHTFFTNTLRQALDMLEQRAEVKSVKRIITPQVSGVTPELHNLFSALEFEDCVNVEGSATQEHRPNKNKTLPPHIDDGMDVITAEDIFMRVDCFFDDLSNMQHHVIDLWKRYRHGDIDVVAAAMSTNAALTFAEQMETELLEFLEANFPASQMTSTVPISGVLSTPGRFLQHIFTEPDYEWPLDPINACAIYNEGDI